MRSPTRPSLLLLLFALGCSFGNYDYLKEGEGAAAGKGGKGGGGSAGKAGSASGGGTNRGGSGSGGSSRGGGGAPIAGGGASAGAAGSVSIYKQLGPWEFNSLAEAQANWEIVLKGTSMGWIQAGASTPLGAITISCDSKIAAEYRHQFSPIGEPINSVVLDLSSYAFRAYAKALNGTANLMLSAIDSNFRRGDSVTLALDNTSWKQLELNVSAPAARLLDYNPARIIFVIMTLPGCGDTVVIDRAELVHLGGGGAAGAAGAAGASGGGGTAGTAGSGPTAGSAGRANAVAGAGGSAGRANAGGTSGASAVSGTAGR